MSYMNFKSNVSTAFMTLCDRAASFMRRSVSAILRKSLSIAYLFSYPVVKILFSFVAVVLLTNVMYVAMKLLFYPVGVVNEEVHFDYSSERGPSTNLTLLTIDKQWYYAQEFLGSQQDDTFSQSYFGNMEYDITLDFTVAYSAKNFEIGKCMVYLHILDCYGQKLATSVRTLRLPYQSHYRIVADTILKMPLYLSNVLHESATIQVPMMRGFHEVDNSRHASCSLQVMLSKEGAAMDIERCFIVIEPRPTGISYMFYSFPFVSFLALNSLFISIFVASTIMLYLMSYTLARPSLGTTGVNDDVDDLRYVGDDSDSDTADMSSEIEEE